MLPPWTRLRTALHEALPTLHAITDADAAQRPAPGKWSPKEIIGHLIDSASNNHGRFVRAQGLPGLRFDGYDQEHWVRAQHYNSAHWGDLVTLWQALNLHLAHVMELTPEVERLRPRTDHNMERIAFHAPLPGAPATLEAFMHDYVDHLQHHLRQVLAR